MNQKTDFTKIDAAILASVTQGATRFSGIANDYTVVTEAKAIAQATGRKIEQIIDGRLQRLRTQRKLNFYNASGWRIGDKLPQSEN